MHTRSILTAMLTLTLGGSWTGTFPAMGQTARRGRADASSPYQAVEKSLVMISAGGGRKSGSGFIWLREGRHYLVTNEHVVRAGRPFAARLLDGTKLTLESMEVAVDRDLVRFVCALPDGVSGLESRAERPSLEERIWVFGNSDAGEVVTSESGRVLGVGSDRIEVNARFVAGNSGSPIVDANGRVLAVATYAQLQASPDDWIKSGTRYGQVRRFGFLPDGATWKAVEVEDYFLRAEAMADIEVFCEDLRSVYNKGFLDVFVAEIQYEYAKHESSYQRLKYLCHAIDQSVRSRNLIVERHGRAMQAQANTQTDQRRGVRSMSTEHETAWQLRLAQQEYEKLCGHFIHAVEQGERLLDHDHWLTVALKQEADRLLSYLRFIKNRYDLERFRPD